MKAVVKYPGSKWSLAGWIISFFPEHHSYLEPFFGSGAVFFNKPRSNIETVNDLDGNVVNLFEWVKRDPERLAHEIYWTPYARQVYEDAYAAEPEDSLGRAVNFYIKLNMGYGFRTNGEKSGWKTDVQGRERAYASLDWCSLPEKIMQAAERFRGVQIENRSAVEVIRRFNSPRVLVYADPPYVLGARHGKQYRHEMDDRDHRELLEVLLEHRGPALISGYDTDLYRDMLKGWHREERCSRSQSGRRKREILWMNFEPQGQVRISDMCDMWRKTEMDRYVFIFDYEGGWMILLYENGENTKYFNSAENDWDNSLDYADLFIENGGKKYYYMLPSYDCVKDIDVFGLENCPIDSLERYLMKS